MTDVLRAWRTAANAPVGELRPGRDLVLEARAMETGALPEGTLLDDFLDLAEREAIEQRARAATASWADRNRGVLTVDGVDLTWVWEVELYRDAALPAARVIAGVSRAVAATGARRLELHGVDRLTAEALREIVDPVDVDVRAAEPLLEVRADASGLGPLQRALVATGIGAPQWIQGDLRVVHQWPFAPVLAELERGGAHAPVLDVASLPPVGARRTASLARRGGWLGVPGARRRKSSERRVLVALAELRVATGDAQSALLHARAVELLRGRARETLALVERNERAFATGRIRLAVVPFDSVASVRAILAAARATAVPSLLLQHGYAPEPHDPDKGQVDHVAVWAQRDADEVTRRFSKPVTVTGNPAAPAPVAGRRPVLAGGGCTLALVQTPTLYSVRWGARVSQRFVERTLSALARSRPGGRVILRPHPMEPNPDALLRLTPRDLDLRVEVDTRSPIGELIDRSDLCVGGVSTATLQAAAAGLPVAILDATGASPPRPFDGEGGAPTAADVDGLAAAIDSALRYDGVAGAGMLAEALGSASDSTARVLDLIDAVAR